MTEPRGSALAAISRLKLRFFSLRTRFGLGAGLIGLVAIATSALTIYGMTRISATLEAALQAERRIERYSMLSTRVGSYIVVTLEAMQSGLPADERMARTEGLTADIETTFAAIRADLEEAVGEARALGLDEQSRRATQSLGIARMEALFSAARRRLEQMGARDETARAHVDAFSNGMDTLLNSVISDELRARGRLLQRIEVLRLRLTRLAFALAATALALLAIFQFGLVWPQLRRLERLREDAARIAAGRFDLPPVSRSDDEIGALVAEMHELAAALGARKADVEADWERLTETVAERTRALREANVLLARRDEDRRRFFADVSHELRTPLTVILMEAELGRLSADPVAAEGYATIHDRASRLNRRIDDLLRLARSDAGQLALDPEPLALRDIVVAAGEEIANEAAGAGLAFEVAPADAGAVMADPNWTRQVLAGLMRNALRHARDGGRLKLTCGQDAGGFPFAEVIDNGPGLGTDTPEKLFARFAQGGGPRREGFGLGLALARWVIEQQGGRIELTSPVPRASALGPAPGTMVTLFFARPAP